jgi:predicted  nucleic acid-binding Zn-ribbon protein
VPIREFDINDYDVALSVGEEDELCRELRYQRLSAETGKPVEWEKVFAVADAFLAAFRDQRDYTKTNVAAALADADVENTEAELQTLTDRVAELETDNDDLLTENHNVSDENDELRAEVERLRSRVAELETAAAVVAKPKRTRKTATN